jgi:TDG/mug DNA glycosylase family protein
MNVLPDVLGHDLDIVFCGTAAGKQSALAGAYYAGRGNLFWPTLYSVGLTPIQLLPQQFQKVSMYGLGLTDLAKSVSGSDASLQRAHFSPEVLVKKLREYQPRILAFTSKRAACEFLGCRIDYGRLAQPIEGAIGFVLTSPSGLARGYWQDARFWHELAALRRRLGQERA